MKYKKFFAIKTTFTLLVALTVFTASCSPDGFSRGIAAKAIQEDKRFASAATMTIDVRGKLSNAEGKTWQISKDDTAEAATIRAKADFTSRQPQLLVAENLGYLKLYFDEPELGEKELNMPYDLFRQDLGVWRFKVRAEITEEGKSLWKDLNLAVDEKSLPLAVRGTPEITGMKDEAQQTMKSAEFTYKWQPSELGKAFDPSSDEFKQLPANLQEALKQNQYNIFGGGGNNTLDFKNSRTGRAFFQKFDDGWRLSNLAFL